MCVGTRRGSFQNLGEIARDLGFFPMSRTASLITILAGYSRRSSGKNLSFIGGWQSEKVS
jgi:hypothetical protein